MRLKSVSVSGFRAFANEVQVDLDADVVLLSGVNGSGKTSLMDSILWALTGTVPRLGSTPELVSRYSSTGEARVEVTLQHPAGPQVRIVRRFDGETSVSVQIGDNDPVFGTVAEARLLETLWPDAVHARDPWEALSRSITRAVYLQQDSVRDFVEADSDEERFHAVGEIVGVGRVAELSKQLASARTRWSRATNNLEEEVGPQRARLNQLEARLQSLEGTGIEVELLDQDWESWRQRAAEAVGEPLGAGRDRAQEVNRLLEALQRTLDQAHRRERQLANLHALLQDPVSQPTSIDEVRLAFEAAERTREEANERMAEAQQQAALERRRALEEQEESERLATMAAIALDHLDANCPVCGQVHDVESTRQRLAAYVDQGASEPASHAGSGVAQAAAALQQSEEEAARLGASLRDLEAQGRAFSAWRSQVGELAVGLGFGEAVSSDEVAAARDEVSVEATEVASLRDAGRRLGLDLARLDEQQQRSAIEAQLVELRGVVQGQELELQRRAETTEVANRLLDGLRDASEELVRSELRRMEPLLQRIYSTVDPHPSFQAVGFLTRTVRGRGRLWTPLHDVVSDESVQEPSAVLSSSQLNVLAVSTFLALNLSVETLPLDVISLDDPLQSLDDVNLLGLADLVRRTRGRRQILISTHDQRLAGLLRRKLRPVREDQRTRLVELSAWSRRGPIVEQQDVPPDAVSLRLVG